MLRTNHFVGCMHAFIISVLMGLLCAFFVGIIWDQKEKMKQNMMRFEDF